MEISGWWVGDTDMLLKNEEFEAAQARSLPLELSSVEATRAELERSDSPDSASGDL